MKNKFYPVLLIGSKFFPFPGNPLDNFGAIEAKLMGTEEEGGCGGGGAAAATAAASHRIYVGGLGGNVTAEDLKNTFSSPQLGSVESVEIVRTKGRSFAYLDFVPSSDKGLAKLFSTVSLLSLHVLCFNFV